MQINKYLNYIGSIKLFGLITNRPIISFILGFFIVLLFVYIIYRILLFILSILFKKKKERLRKIVEEKIDIVDNINIQNNDSNNTNTEYFKKYQIIENSDEYLNYSLYYNYKDRRNLVQGDDNKFYLNLAK